MSFANPLVTSMIFFPEKEFYETPEDYGLSAEDIFFQTLDGLKLHGWFFEGTGDRFKNLSPVPERTLLFFHGNAGNISGRLFKAKGWLERGFSVFLVGYRGYGKSEGKAGSEQDILKDAAAAWDYLTRQKEISPEKIILYGESLGTYPATALAGQHQAAALILESPFTSFVELAGVHYPLVPKALLKGVSFSTIDKIAAVRCRVFILHGTEDEICPYDFAQKLFKKAPEPKEFFTIHGGMHNDLPVAAGEKFWQKPVDFILRGR